MTEIKLLRRKDYKKLPWKNGLGITQEISIFPAACDFSQGNFLWRLSAAEIDSAGSFSTFPGYDRTLVILDGSGVRLNGKELRPLVPFKFSGETQTQCELISGPVNDINVFAKRGEIKASVAVKVLAQNESFDWNSSKKWNFIFIVSGEVVFNAQTAAAGDTIFFEQTVATQITANSYTTELLLIQLD